MAVKTFRRKQSMVQEYIALRYLRDCPHVVEALGISISSLEILMRLHEGNLRKWLKELSSKAMNPKNHPSMPGVIADICAGVVEIHDRGMVHGDLKPSNMLVDRAVDGSLKVTLGDCGFTSGDIYAKVKYTARIYRDPNPGKSRAHDVYSLAICFLEIVHGITAHFDLAVIRKDGKVHERNLTYDEICNIIEKKVPRSARYFPRALLLSMVDRDKEQRPCARSLMEHVAHGNPMPPMWKPIYKREDCGSSFGIGTATSAYVRKRIKRLCHDYGVEREKLGYIALSNFLHRRSLSIHEGRHPEYSQVDPYIIACVYVLSGMFGGGYENNVDDGCLNDLITDDVFVSLVCVPTREHIGAITA